MKILIETIPHLSHRLETIGDWQVYWDKIKNEDGVYVGLEPNILIRVSELKNWKQEALIAFHELAEVLMCISDGVKESDVDDFDNKFEAERAPDDFSEPGDRPDAPYCKQHLIATGLEKVLAAGLGVNWHEYEMSCNALPFRKDLPNSGHPVTQGPVSTGD